LVSEAAVEVSGVLFEEATERERARATGVAAGVRLGAVSAFLLLSLALYGRARPEWAVYVPLLLGYAVLSLVLFLLRHRPLSPRIGWLLGLMDVGAVYVIQREALPLTSSPAAMASFTLGPLAAVVALTALTLRTRAIVGAAALATVAEVLLMRQAHLPLATMAAAGMVLTLMAVISHAVLRRLRFLVIDVLREELERHLEQRRRTETDAAKQIIERMLAEAEARSERLGRLQREKESLVQLIVHDLRSPLNAVMLSIEYVSQEVKLRHAGGDLSEALEDARSTANRLSGMVSQILETAKLEEGQLFLERSSIGAAEMLRQVGHQLAPMARDKSVEVRVEADADLGLRGDPRLFGRVFENLLSNSIRHTPAGGQILLSAHREGRTCRMSVHNSGPAIAACDRDRIFAKFQQGGDGARLGGWGLGLYFCRMVLEAHDGTIVVEDAEGWSTSFVMRVPAEAQSAAQAQAS
jgi:two-component system, OmpR family, heavy metal sensor histidine kinase CusS